MSADIPFEFHVGEAVLPPGTYSFGTSLALSNMVLKVAGDGQRIYKIALNERPHPSDGRSVAVFNKYRNGSHFLAEVRIPGQPVRKMPLSESEREIITTDWSVRQIALALRPAKAGDRN